MKEACLRASVVKKSGLFREGIELLGRKVRGFVLTKKLRCALSHKAQITAPIWRLQ